MSYNIHPLFVHFPIAFLFVYSLIKIIPLKNWFPKVSWKDIERVLLVVGVLGAFAALSTGEAAEHLFRSNRQLVEMHTLFASGATWIYALLLSGEIVAILTTKQFSITGNKDVAKILRFIERVFCNTTFSALLAVVGLVAISIAGLLGGVITYGVTADPVAPFVLKILGISL